MSGLPWFKCFPQDLLNGMAGMPADERGIYISVLCLIYREGAPIRDEPRELAYNTGCTIKAWTRYRAALILHGKLKVVQVNGRDCLSNDRCEAELAARNAKSDTLAENGREGARRRHAITDEKPNENNDSALANAKQMPSKSLAIIDTDTEVREEANASLSSADDAPVPPKYPEPFEAIWKAYPHVKGRSSKPKAFAVWRRLPVNIRSSLPPAIARYAREGREPKADCGAPAMERWLRDGRYEDWIAQPDGRPIPKPEPAVYAAHVRHYRDTGEWKPAWGERPNLETAA